MSLKTLYIFDGMLNPNAQMEAELMQMELEKSGIESFIAGSEWNMLKPHVGNVILKVEEEDFDRAVIAIKFRQYANEKEPDLNKEQRIAKENKELLNKLGSSFIRHTTFSLLVGVIMIIIFIILAFLSQK